jgi:hypothetical protein
LTLFANQPTLPVEAIPASVSAGQYGPEREKGMSDNSLNPAVAAARASRELQEFEAKIVEAAVTASEEDKVAAQAIADSGEITSVETINPIVAAILFVELNKYNRDFSLAKAHAYARQMRLGYWRLVHQGLAFYPNKKLADGQHRLAAIFLSGMTLQFTVFRNFEEDAMQAIDTGKRRTAGDAFGITGLVARDHAKIAGAMVDRVMKYEALRSEAKRINPSIYEQEAWAKEHKAMLLASLALMDRIVKGDPVLTKPEVGTMALAMVLGGYELGQTEGYLTDVLESIGRYADSPAVDLHRQLLKAKNAASAKGKLTNEEKMALTFKGAALYVQGLTTGGLRWKPGKEPLPAPVPPIVLAAAD